MPLFAAWMVLMPVDIASSRAPRSLARLLKPCDVKKFVGLSSAELTRLPVASLVCVDVIRSEVCCRFSRFDRTPAERTISLILGYLPGVGSAIPIASDRARQHGSVALKQVEQTWLTGGNRYKIYAFGANVRQIPLLSAGSQAAERAMLRGHVDDGTDNFHPGGDVKHASVGEREGIFRKIEHRAVSKMNRRGCGCEARLRG